MKGRYCIAIIRIERYFNLKIGAKLEFNFKILKLAPNVNFILKLEKARNLDFFTFEKNGGKFQLIFLKN